MKKAIAQILLQVILPLLAGLAIYLLFRNHTWLHRQFFPNIARPVIQPENNLTAIIAYNMPDFCWAYSFTSALLIWNNHSTRRIRHLPLFILTFLLLSEVLQYWTPSYFTFDWRDLAATSVAFSLSYFANRE
jgi:predicted Na+-dependent transporter